MCYNIGLIRIPFILKLKMTFSERTFFIFMLQFYFQMEVKNGIIAFFKKKIEKSEKTYVKVKRERERMKNAQFLFSSSFNKTKCFNLSFISCPPFWVILGRSFTSIVHNLLVSTRFSMLLQSAAAAFTREVKWAQAAVSFHGGMEIDCVYMVPL